MGVYKEGKNWKVQVYYKDWQGNQKRKQKKISIELERNQNQAVLRISNQVTYPEQINIDHVFERFYKADAARSKTSTGLGLSIARELVSRMNGEIEAKIEKEEFIVEMRFPLVADEMGNILLSVTVE